MFTVAADFLLPVGHSQEGRVFVVKMGSEFALLATNTLEDQIFIATPAIVDGEVFLRSQAALCCISPSS